MELKEQFQKEKQEIRAMAEKKASDEIQKQVGNKLNELKTAIATISEKTKTETEKELDYTKAELRNEIDKKITEKLKEFDKFQNRIWVLINRVVKKMNQRGKTNSAFVASYIHELEKRLKEEGVIKKNLNIEKTLLQLPEFKGKISVQNVVETKLIQRAIRKGTSEKKIRKDLKTVIENV